MTDIFTDMARVMELLTAPMGAYAPRLRRMIVDYKDSSGRDYHQDLMIWHNPSATDADLVENVRESLVQQGYTLSALGELLDNGGANVLYLMPGYLEESIKDLGLSVPDDIAAALTAAGVHPVNWEELTHGS